MVTKHGFDKKIYEGKLHIKEDIVGKKSRKEIISEQKGFFNWINLVV